MALAMFPWVCVGTVTRWRLLSTGSAGGAASLFHPSNVSISMPFPFNTSWRCVQFPAPSLLSELTFMCSLNPRSGYPLLLCV